MNSDSNKISEGLEQFITLSAGDYLHPSATENLITLLNESALKFPVTASTENNIRRILENVLDRGFFYNSLIQLDYYREILFAVASHSNYLTDIVVRNPEYLSWVLDLVPLETDLDKENLDEEIRSSFSRFKNFDTKLRRLKSIKRAQTLRIGLKDILGMRTVKQVTRELSELAVSITDGLFRLCLNEIKEKNKITDPLPDYCLVALGKFGGMELNYSSDIDLILFFSENPILDEKKDAFEIFSEAVHLFINSASVSDEAGFLYRVDFRLRPDGRTSPLCRTLNDSLSYYESRGEYWERQMLIKSGFVSGSEELYKKFSRGISPFIYPATFNVSPSAQIKKIRSSILARQGSESNIKLSRGGIRDIEFSVQVLQMINGGAVPSIRTGNTLDAIDKLEDHKLLSSDEAGIFRDSYNRYRKVEHYLQLMNDRQTHTLPDDPDMLYKLSAYLGFPDPVAFINDLERRKKTVSGIYDSIMGGNESEPSANPIELIKFSDRKKAEKNYLYLSEGRGLLEQKSFDSRTLDLFRDIESYLIYFLNSSPSPDQVLENFVRIIKAGHIPSVWYDLFKDETIFNSFLICCERSQRFINILARDTFLMEELISGSLFTAKPADSLSGYHLQRLFARSSALVSLGIQSQREASDSIAHFCKSRISEAADLVLSESGMNFEYSIIALGSCANNQMSFTSDIDLIFISGDENLPDDIQDIFMRILGRARELCAPVKVDCRLRPEGQSSPLVWSISAYKKYLETRARIWEFQSLTKISLVCGSGELYSAFLTNIVSALSRHSVKFVAAEIVQMRKKYLSQVPSATDINIKKGKGGIGDIEFLIQFLILINSDYFVKLAGENTLDAIQFLSVQGLLSQEDSGLLANNFRFLKEAEMGAQIIFDISTAPTKDKLNSKSLKQHLELEYGAELYEELRRILNKNSEILSKYYNG